MELAVSQGNHGTEEKHREKVLLRRPRPAKISQPAAEVPRSIGTNYQDLKTPPTSVQRSTGTLGPLTSSMARQIPLSRDDKKWVLDSSYNSRQATAHSKMYCKNLLHPYKPRGPDRLQPRDIRRHLPFFSEFVRSDEDVRYSKPPLFTLNDFIMDVAKDNKISIAEAQKIILSSANYKKITAFIAAKLNGHNTTISFVDVDLDAMESMDEVPQRVPHTQGLFEMAALIKERVKEALHFEVECKVKKLPKYTPGYHLGEAPHSEIVLFEKKKAQEIDRIVTTGRLTGHPTKETIFSTGSMRKHFQEATRSSSPFTYDENQISPAEICVLDCMLTGGIALSLKANFIASLPDISVLCHTLTYVNLSYNNFKEIPAEIFRLSSLQILKMRSNPLSILSSEIDLLTQLESLVVSFCLITTIPVSLYNLKRLRILDVSYNKISFLHREIKHLRNLTYLNVEGNELTSLPNAMLAMQLKRIRVRNNYLHPLLWAENSVNQPQQLQDLAAMAFYHSGLTRRYSLLEEPQADPSLSQPDERRLPDDIRQMLVSQLEACECCGGPMFGPGLRLIRPAKRLFGVRYLPLLFASCSPHCRQVFLSSDAQIAERLYQCRPDSSRDLPAAAAEPAGDEAPLTPPPAANGNGNDVVEEAAAAAVAVA